MTSSTSPSQSPTGLSRSAWPLRAAAVVEALSLLVLLINLVTAPVASIAAAVGPVHGCAYLIAIALTWTGPYSRAARRLAVIPGIGALLAARQAGSSGRA